MACPLTPISCSTSAVCRTRILSLHCAAGPGAIVPSSPSWKKIASTREFIDRIEEYLRFAVPYYIAEGKSYLTVAIGCTGGRHRSVMIAERLKRLSPIWKARESACGTGILRTHDSNAVTKPGTKSAKNHERLLAMNRRGLRDQQSLR